MEVITSLQNERVKRLRALAHDRAIRRRLGLFVLEGDKLVRELLASERPIAELYATPAALERLGDDGRALVQRSAEAFVITDAIAEKVSDVKTPQGVLCVLPLPAEPLLDEQAGARFIACEDLQDAGNAGTIIRTAAALGLDGAIFLGSAPDPYAGKVLRASAGMSMKLPVYALPDIAALKRALPHTPVLGAMLNGDDPATVGKLTRGVVLVGNEGQGLQSETVAQCDRLVTIPIDSSCESLNASVAAALLMWTLLANRE